MLSLFTTPQDALTFEEAFVRARDILSSFLNKGTIPSWSDYLRELPLQEDSGFISSVQSRFEKLTQGDFLFELIESKPGQEYFFHSPSDCQYQTTSGEKKKFICPIEEADWQTWLEIISLRYKQNWNVQNPFASFQGYLFERPFRWTLIHAATSPVARSKLILRSLSSKAFHLSDFGNSDMLKSLILDKKNVLIAGATASGKTSLLSSLIEEIPHHEHLIILEDTFEITNTHPHQTRFLSGPTPQTDLKAYLTYSLRLSPDRLILGEMRSHEVVPFLMSMNTGHRGLMGTIHATSAVDALSRFALLFSIYANDIQISYEKIMELVCKNLDVILFVENKKVKEMIKVIGCEKGVPYFEKIPS
jgi:type IV secretion system protein VirB11